jgi:hypothetical protein
MQEAIEGGDSTKDDIVALDSSTTPTSKNLGKRLAISIEDATVIDVDGEASSVTKTPFTKAPKLIVVKQEKAD